MLARLLGRQFDRRANPRPWANRRRLAPGRCAAYLSLLFVAGLSTPAAAQTVVSISAPTTVTEPSSGQTLVSATVQVYATRNKKILCEIVVSSGTASEFYDWQKAYNDVKAYVYIPENSQSSESTVFYVLADQQRESDETVIVSLTEVLLYNPGANGYVSSDDLVISSTASTATVTIKDYRPPPPKPKVSIADASATEGSAVAFTVSVSPTYTKAMTLSYATADGTATTADADYTGTSSGSVTIPANTPSASFSVATGNDAKDESDETFTVTLSGAPADVDVTRATATGTINDNDDPAPPPPRSSVSIADASATEGSAVTFTVSVSPTHTKAITLSYATADGTATTADGDYTSTSGSVTIPANAPSASFSVATGNDTKDEPNETFSVTLSGAPAGVDITRATATGTILDNDEPPPPVVSIAGGSAITEGGAAVFTLSASPAPPASITVNVNVTQTGSFATSGQTGTKQVTIGTGGSASLTVATQDDNTDEPNGSITARVNTGTNYVPATNNTATVNVNDNDEPPTPVVSIAGGSTITEGGTATFTLSATPKPATSITVTVNVTQTGDFAASGQTGTKQVTLGTSGSASLTVATVNDNTDEASGTITATVRNGNKYSPSSTHGSATVTVNDNDEPPPQTPVVSIAGGSTITEGGNATFTLSATPKPAASITVEVNVTQTGSFAANGQTGTKQVTIGTGGSASLTVATVNDNTDEASGSITATIGTGTGYSPSGNNGTATVTVNDNDEPPPQTPIVRIDGSSTITEGGVAVFTLSATPAPPASITVNVNVTQTGSFAASGQTGTRQMTLGTGGTASLTVSTQDDNTDEAHGSITATISTGTGYSPSGTHGSATINVNDNDEPTTATAGNTGTQVTNPGEDNDEPIQDPPIQDTPIQDTPIQDKPEQDNSIQDEPIQDSPKQDGSGSSNQPTPPGPQPPPPDVSLDDVTIIEGGIARFVVRLPEALADTVVVEWATTSMEAIAGQDYDAGRGRVRIPPGETQAIIVVLTMDDTEQEDDEIFKVRLLNTPSEVEAFGTITDNDDASSTPAEDSLKSGTAEDRPEPEPFVFTEAVADQVYTAEAAIRPLVLPAASGGIPPMTYKVVGLPAGLTFDPTTRTIAGTPIAATDGAVSVLYYVTDSSDEMDTLIFTITVNPPLSFGDLFGSGKVVPTFSLADNVPNPFNPTTTIQYALPQAADVELTVYNVLGQPVRTLVAEYQDAGRYAVEWDATDASGQSVSSGMYFYRLQAGEEFREVKKMLLLR